MKKETEALTLEQARQVLENKHAPGAISREPDESEQSTRGLSA